MIYFITEPLIGGSLKLTVTETGSRSKSFICDNMNIVSYHIDRYSKTFWQGYVISKFYYYTNVDIKERSGIIANLYNSLNTLELVNILRFTAIPALYKAGISEDEARELKECELWCRAYKGRNKEIPQPIDNNTKSITFENEVHRPPISEIFGIKK